MTATLTLILTYCAADLSACQRTRTPGFTAPMACALAAVTTAPEWLAAGHDGYRVTEMRCGRGRT